MRLGVDEWIGTYNGPPCNEGQCVGLACLRLHSMHRISLYYSWINMLYTQYLKWLQVYVQGRHKEEREHAKKKGVWVPGDLQGKGESALSYQASRIKQSGSSIPTRQSMPIGHKGKKVVKFEYCDGSINLNNKEILLPPFRKN